MGFVARQWDRLVYQGQKMHKSHSCLDIFTAGFSLIPENLYKCFSYKPFTLKVEALILSFAVLNYFKAFRNCVLSFLSFDDLTYEDTESLASFG